MKIKHWQGYGCVNAVKAKNDVDGCVLHIVVTGEHEWGLNCDDNYYHLFNWLVKRFDKTFSGDAYDYKIEYKVQIEEVSWKECHYRFFKKNKYLEW